MPCKEQLLCKEQVLTMSQAHAVASGLATLDDEWSGHGKHAVLLMELCVLRGQLKHVSSAVAAMADAGAYFPPAHCVQAADPFAALKVPTMKSSRVRVGRRLKMRTRSVTESFRTRKPCKCEQQIQIISN